MTSTRYIPIQGLLPASLVMHLCVFQGENTAQLKVVLAENSTLSTGDVIASMDRLTENIPGLDISFAEEQSALKSILGTDEAPVVVEVRGEDLDEIESVLNQVKDKMMTIPGLFNIQTSVEDGAPEVEVRIDRIRAGMYNLDINAVSDTDAGPARRNECRPVGTGW
jgi:hydrophobic/amphiphilic exporter-1 (mainly G- bacteria), HAE1 family